MPQELRLRVNQTVECRIFQKKNKMREKKNTDLPFLVERKRGDIADEKNYDYDQQIKAR